MQVKYTTRSLAIFSIVCAIASQYTDSYALYLYGLIIVSSSISAAVYIANTKIKEEEEPKKNQPLFYEKEQKPGRELYDFTYDECDTYLIPTSKARDEEDEDIFYGNKISQKQTEITLH
jgi:hypothetical protein